MIIGFVLSTHAPSPETARVRYDEVASRYDLTTRLLERPRRMAVDALSLAPGQIALDIACGTGLNLGRLRQAVGPTGRVVGIDVSAGMLEVARARIAANGWENVELREADLAATDLPRADAALFSFTHDVLRMPGVVARVADAVRGGGISATGVKYAIPAAFPVNAAVRLIAPRFVTTREGLHQPWSYLARVSTSFSVRSLLFGSLYVASGRVS